jgi:hypothetical protein
VDHHAERIAEEMPWPLRELGPEGLRMAVALVATLVLVLLPGAIFLFASRPRKVRLDAVGWGRNHEYCIREAARGGAELWILERRTRT